MRTVLALLGCAGRVEVALASPSLAAPSVVALASPEPRANLLLQAVHQVLQAAQLKVSDLELVVATTGPGSFTGIRNTLACAWGFAQACHLPVHGFSSLLVQAARSAEAAVLAVQPARKGWFYAQPFLCKEGWIATAPVEVLRQEELASQPLSVVAPPGLKLPPEVKVASTCRTPAEALLALGVQLESPDSSTLVPSYVEAFPASREP
ncbi:MAG: tRNA (adenosine(37)-N6)-threonylcarbamoyltransferase complex dimerization subunit type 1 TsaB [Acidobacteriota bacterium]